MLKGKSIAVVIPAYNEEKQIGMVIETIPDFVDRIVIVNDCSRDRTHEIVQTYFDKAGISKLVKAEQRNSGNKYYEVDKLIEKKQFEEIKYYPPSEVIHPSEDNRLILINMIRNSGVGWAISRGYKWARDHGIECIAVMAGDGQMDPEDLPALLDPIATGRIEDLIGQLQSLYTIVIVTHNMQQAARVSDHTGFMLLGELVEFGVTRQLFTNPREKQTEDYITGRFG